MKTPSDMFPYDTPPWRHSHKAVSPSGSLVAEIKEACEHSMGNPTVGILRTSDGLELPHCNPAFIWSDDSRYLAVPQWHKRFGLFLRQRLALVDTIDRVVYVSRFTYWLMQPVTFERSRLEILVSGRWGINSLWRESPLILDVPPVPSTFPKLQGIYQ